jgi:hypothetical protein
MRSGVITVHLQSSVAQVWAEPFQVQPALPVRVRVPLPEQAQALRRVLPALARRRAVLQASPLVSSPVDRERARSPSASLPSRVSVPRCP